MTGAASRRRRSLGGRRWLFTCPHAGEASPSCICRRGRTPLRLGSLIGLDIDVSANRRVIAPCPEPSRSAGRSAAGEGSATTSGEVCGLGARADGLCLPFRPSTRSLPGPRCPAANRLNISVSGCASSTRSGPIKTNGALERPRSRPSLTPCQSRERNAYRSQTAINTPSHEPKRRAHAVRQIE